ncbi:hypothetical protein FSARC_1607 [Fusarium sarcochroum]|uniref:Ankyrin repeat protein n=1 Tax=Fusarium sarcochroum TaxID=1208366 RepID=A0A8H4U8B4_9HYPO|nr:hypothetical protein FSARC_1607 [Fusarium sarcochroum]
MHSSSDIVEIVFGLSSDKDAEDKRGRTALHFACKAMNWITVHQLVQLEADEHSTLASLAFAKTDPSRFNALLEKGATTGLSNHVVASAPLIYMISKEGSTKDVNALLGVLNQAARSKIVNFRHCEDYTPLHVAAQKNNEETLKALLREGADPNFRDGRMMTPLHSAIEAESGTSEQIESILSLIGTLLDSGADLWPKNSYWLRPSAYAGEKGKKEIADYLLLQERLRQ